MEPFLQVIEVKEKPRKIIHVDMDSFFAAVEQRDFPQYRNKPLIVGGSPQSRGVVATCSYEARQFGVHSAMPSSQAYRLCPQAIFVKPRFAVYQEASRQIREVFADYTELFEPISLDEAYLDVSDVSLCNGSATLIAKAIKTDIRQKTQLIASAGISYNKFLAKMASGLGKPDGLYVITPEQGEAFVLSLPVGKFHGIGKATAAKMYALGIHTGEDLKQQPLSVLQAHFGKAAAHFYAIARGQDLRPVNAQRIRKSLGVETTFAEDIYSKTDVLEKLQDLFYQVLQKAEEKRFVGHTLTIKVKYHNFVQITRSRTFSAPINIATVPVFEELLHDTGLGERKIRLLGISLAAQENRQVLATAQQLDLFSQFEQ